MKIITVDSRTTKYSFTKSEKSLFELKWNELIRDKQNVVDLETLSDSDIEKAKESDICYTIECIRLRHNFR
ncbi:hypothetical protein [Anaerorhabdus sp.]|uniref:hypothetical protein n=1 Tax=Anaerorhabdus sp. TaxID=1872524 RepID=UPI002FC93EE4